MITQNDVEAWKDMYEMSFEEYQVEADKTAIYPDEHKIVYPALGLAGEAGEVANKVKTVSYTHLTLPTTPYV